MKRQRDDHGVARRANALLLLDDGKSCVEIAQVLYLDDDTVRGWHKQYLAEGWDAVAYDGWKGGQSRLFVAQQVAQSITIESGGESSFRGVNSYKSGLLWFDEPRLKWTSFAGNEEFSDHTVWASCSKF